MSNFVFLVQRDSLKRKYRKEKTALLIKRCVPDVICVCAIFLLGLLQ